MLGFLEDCRFGKFPAITEVTASPHRSGIYKCLVVQQAHLSCYRLEHLRGSQGHIRNTIHHRILTY
jgi:hypothetical protein